MSLFVQAEGCVGGEVRLRGVGEVYEGQGFGWDPLLLDISVKLDWKPFRLTWEPFRLN